MSALANRPFVKMNGLGNEIVVVDMRQTPSAISADAARAVAQPGGVPYDQLMALYPPRTAGTASLIRIYNNDGSSAGACGNGMRCVASLIGKESGKDKLTFEVDGRVLDTWKNADGLFTVDMGAPRFAPRDIPFNAAVEQPTYPIDVGGERIVASVLSMGNPHAVQQVADVDMAPVRTQGPLLENHPDFPRRVNAGYMQVVSRDHIRLRVWERGAGETLACGTGACAAVVAGIRLGLLGTRVRVSTRGGDLAIEWPSRNAPVMMTGDAVRVFHGEIEI